MTALGGLHRARTWFGLALFSALVTLGFAFTVVGLVAEALTFLCLVIGLILLARGRRTS